MGSGFCSGAAVLRQLLGSPSSSLEGPRTHPSTKPSIHLVFSRTMGSQGGQSEVPKRNGRTSGRSSLCGGGRGCRWRPAFFRASVRGSRTQAAAGPASGLADSSWVSVQAGHTVTPECPSPSPQPWHSLHQVSGHWRLMWRLALHTGTGLGCALQGNLQQAGRTRTPRGLEEPATIPHSE